MAIVEGFVLQKGNKDVAEWRFGPTVRVHIARKLVAMDEDQSAERNLEFALTDVPTYGYKKTGQVHCSAMPARGASISTQWPGYPYKNDGYVEPEILRPILKDVLEA